MNYDQSINMIDVSLSRALSSVPIISVPCVLSENLTPDFDTVLLIGPIHQQLTPCFTDEIFKPVYLYPGSWPYVQPDHINMAVLLWYLVKSEPVYATVVYTMDNGHITFEKESETHGHV